MASSTVISPPPAQAPARALRALTPERKQRCLALVQEHQDVVWRVLRRLGLSAHAADDATQQVFLIALQRLDDLRPGLERAFLCSTAVWVGRRSRAGKRQEELHDVPPEVPDTRGPEDEAERRRLRAILDELLGQLPHELRVVLVLMELEGLTKRETAAALGLPEGTVATRVRRARFTLDALVKARLGSGDLP